MRQKYFHYYDTSTYISSKQTKKKTSNKLAPEIFSFQWYLYFIINKRNKQYIFARNIFILMIPILYFYFIKTKKEKARNFRQKYFHSYDTYTLLIFHQKQKRTTNKFAPEKFSWLWYLYFTYVLSKRKRNKPSTCARNIFLRMIPILHYQQKEQAINWRQKYFHPYDTYTLLIFYPN